MNLSLGEMSMDLMRAYFTVVTSQRGLSIMEEDWDTLVILDACRYDMFERIVDLPGKTEKRRSKASATDDFLLKNFADGPYLDTVYVTANPRLDTTGDVKSQFHDVVDVWNTDWNDNLETVSPSAMVDRTLEAHQEFPNKRIIAHFMQPHGPFIGEFGREHIGIHSGIANHKRKATGEREQLGEKYVWQLVREGIVNEEVARQAYDENLKIVNSHLESLVTAVNGKTVVTSDHGNMLGERAWPFPLRIWGHPNGILTNELTDVPWHVIEPDNRRTIIAEEPLGQTTDNVSPEIQDRLEQLGYKQDS